MGRCKDCRCFIVRCFRGDRCKRCARVSEVEKLEIAEMEARLVEEQLTTKREMQITALEQTLLEEEILRTTDVMKQEVELTLLETIKLNELRECDVVRTIGFLRKWGYTCEQALEYVRFGAEENNSINAEGNNNEGKEEWKEAAASHLQKCGLTSEQIEYCLNLSMGVESLTENMWVNDAGIRSERIYDSISNSAVDADTITKADVSSEGSDTGSRNTYECVNGESYSISDCISGEQGSLCQQIMQQLGKGKGTMSEDGNEISSQDTFFGDVNKEVENETIPIDDIITHNGNVTHVKNDIIEGQDYGSDNKQDEIPIFESVTFGTHEIKNDDDGDGGDDLVIGTRWSIWDTTELQRMETIGLLQKWGILCKVVGSDKTDRQSKTNGTNDGAEMSDGENVLCDDNSMYEIIALASGSTICDTEKNTNGESLSHTKEKAKNKERFGKVEQKDGEMEEKVGKMEEKVSKIEEKINKMEEKVGAIEEKSGKVEKKSSESNVFSGEKVIGETNAVEEKAIDNSSNESAAHERAAITEGDGSNALFDTSAAHKRAATTEGDGSNAHFGTSDVRIGSNKLGRAVKTQRRKTISYLRQWGFSCEEVLDYLRVTEGKGRASSSESLARVSRKSLSQVSVRTSSIEDLSEEKKRREQIAMLEKRKSFARLREWGFTAEQIFDYKWLSK